MMGRRGMGDAGFARHRPQRQTAEPLPLKHPLGRRKQGVVQVPMVVRGGSGAGFDPTRRYFGRGSCGSTGSGAPGRGNLEGSRHSHRIDHDFDTVKILLDASPRLGSRYLYDVKIGKTRPPMAIFLILAPYGVFALLMLAGSATTSLFAAAAICLLVVAYDAYRGRSI